MLAQTFGRLRQEASERRGVRFERVYDYRADELWAALTQHEQLRGWLGEADLDLREGGGGTLKVGDETTATLSIRRLEPGRLVEYDWNFPDEPPSILRLELEPREKGTLLVLDHRRLAADDAADYGARWHSHLDALELLLVGRRHDWQPRFDELHPGYVDRADELPSDPELGSVQTAGDRGALHLERTLAAPPDEVWRALTEPERWRVWMDADEAALEPRVGGRAELRWRDGEHMVGEVTVWDPPRVLEYTWHERSDRGRVRFELRASGTGTRLVFDQGDIPVSALVGMSAGWHAHLDWLRSHLAGEASFEFGLLYRELRPLYEDALAAA
jgi:uncharacterized protein YndB with AHSA1/START domain